MHFFKKTLLFCLLLSFSFLSLADESNKTDLKTDTNKERLISVAEKQTIETIMSALQPNIKFEKEIFEHIFDNAPSAVKECVEIINKIFNENKDSHEIKQLVQKVLPTRLLFVGPPGTGKSTLAQVVANKLKRDCYFIRMSMLGNEFKNSEGSNLTKILSELSRRKTPMVIILDEINVFGQRKIDMFGEDISAAAVLWSWLDKCALNPYILIIGTANDVTKLPDQLKDRFEGNIIEMSKNEWIDRYFILNYYLSKSSHFCNDRYIRELAQKTEGFSPRQLEELVKVAYQSKYKECGSFEGINQQNMENAYKKFVLSSKILKSKSHFDWKNWFKENSTLIQAVSASVHLSVLLLSVPYLLITGKQIR